MVKKNALTAGIAVKTVTGTDDGVHNSNQPTSSASSFDGGDNESTGSSRMNGRTIHDGFSSNQIHICHFK